MTTMTSLSTSTAPVEQSRQIEWCFLFLEHLNEFATLVWYLVADSKLVECVILRTLARLDSIPFDASLPLLTYNQAVDMLITQAIAALNLGHDQRYDGPMFVERASLCELPDLPRLAFLLELASETEVGKFRDVSAFLVPELVQYATDRMGQRLPAPVGAECYDA
jgi:hypothetical protein